MKRLKSAPLATSLGAIALGAAGLVSPAVSHAATNQGVTCPSDTEAVYSGGVLKCRLPVVTSIASICPPGTSLDSAGSDTCVLRIGPTTTRTPSSPGVGATGAKRVVQATQVDTFTITHYVYMFPTGTFYIGDSSRGVRCRAGFDPVRVNGGRGLRCEDVIVRAAVCDVLWSIERRSGRDHCTMGPIVGEYTIPENAGYTGAMGNPQSHGWNLDVDRSGHGNKDYWVREAKEYAYPESI